MTICFLCRRLIPGAKFIPTEIVLCKNCEKKFTETMKNEVLTEEVVKWLKQQSQKCELNT